MKRLSRGFTLIELMVAVAIIGLLASVVFVSLDGTRQKSRDAVRIGDLKSLSLAAQRYFSENYKFPDSISDLDQYFGDGTSGSAPKDPINNDSYSYYYNTFDTDGGAHKYCLEAMMEIESDGNGVVCGSHDVNYKVIGP